MHIASLNELLKLDEGQSFRFRPIQNIKAEINSVIRIFSPDEEIDKNCTVDVSRVKIELPVDQTLRSEVVLRLEHAPKEHQEIWHQRYTEVDSGNIVDGTGAVSAFLDGLAKALGWPIEGPRFDKVMLRRRDDKCLSAFHCDHFNSKPQRIRTLGHMERVIVNCGTTRRWFAALDIPRHIISNVIADPYSVEDYHRLLKCVDGCPLLLYEMPPVNKNGSVLHGVRFDAFATLHCGYGMRGDIAAVLSQWKGFSST